MTPTRTASVQIHALPDAVLDDVRASDLDASGNPVESVTAEGGEPVRCCLRDAVDGEAVILFGYAPDIPTSPYREVGPVFAHATPCEGPTSTDAYPAGWIGRAQVLRAYDARGWIHPSTRVHDGADPMALIDEMLGDPEVVQVHSRNVAYGCYMFRATRADAGETH
jgi:Protein of unknown function (DUF1203)